MKGCRTCAGGQTTAGAVDGASRVVEAFWPASLPFPPGAAWVAGVMPRAAFTARASAILRRRPGLAPQLFFSGGAGVGSPLDVRVGGGVTSQPYFDIEEDCPSGTAADAVNQVLAMYRGLYPDLECMAYPNEATCCWEVVCLYTWNDPWSGESTPLPCERIICDRDEGGGGGDGGGGDDGGGGFTDTNEGTCTFWDLMLAGTKGKCGWEGGLSVDEGGELWEAEHASSPNPG